MLLNVTTSTVSRWERARQRPSAASLGRLAWFLEGVCRPAVRPKPYDRNGSPSRSSESPPRSQDETCRPRLALIPIGLRQACQYIAENHRHHKPPAGAKFALAVGTNGRVAGVATVGRPVSRHLDDKTTLEVTRVATDGTPNACSMLLGAAVRAARAIGYRRVYSYTLAAEPGSSMRAAGFRLDLARAGGGKWSRADRVRTDAHPIGAKQRWVWP